MNEKVKKKNVEREKSEADDLEEGLEETFPGSDPASATQPGRDEDARKENTDET